MQEAANTKEIEEKTTIMTPFIVTLSKYYSLKCEIK